jgi:hypothetical protein
LRNKLRGIGTEGSNGRCGPLPWCFEEAVISAAGLAPDFTSWDKPDPGAFLCLDGSMSVLSSLLVLIAAGDSAILEGVDVSNTGRATGGSPGRASDNGAAAGVSRETLSGKIRACGQNRGKL